MLNKSRIIYHVCSIFVLCIIAIELMWGYPVLSKVQNAPDPLPSWNDGKAKQAILNFIQSTTTKESSDYVLPGERIATFDQDGTLWVEKPIYSQATFAFDRIKVLAANHPEWKTEQPFAALLSGDRSAIAKFTLQDIEKILAVTHSGMTVEQFNQIIKAWLLVAKHPRFNKSYTELVYQPMLEVMDYFRKNGYQTYIVTGGGQEFVRTYSEKTYGVPPQQVIGSAVKTKYNYGSDDKPELVKQPEIFFVDDGVGKPSSINLIIGRRPYAAFGNSTGDRQMLEWTQAGGGKRLMMLVHHDDAVREYSYGAESKVGTFTDELMSEAKQCDWIVISIKDDWKKIFSFNDNGNSSLETGL